MPSTPWSPGRMENVFVISESEQDRRLYGEIQREQVTHPVHLYQPGSERLERLLAAVESQRRFEWPRDMEPNL